MALNKDDFERISGYAKVAMNLLKRGGIPPTPQFYELLYVYASGISPALNARINKNLRTGNSPNEELIALLHKEFIDSNDFGERLNHVSSEISARITSVHGALAQAHASANAYSGLLQSASGDMAEGISSQNLATLTDNLLLETRKMQVTNTKLEERLDTARDHIGALQYELEQARRESMIDPLTQISNRKAFDRAMDAVIEKAQNTGETFGLVMVDIDHFKAFNDNHGHTIGDQVLRLVGSTLDKQSKNVDIAARYGGEEFGVILPGANLEEATKMAERLREAIQSRELLKRSTKEVLGKVTASFGVCVYREGDTVISVIERADACLYAAKRNGRNRVVSEAELTRLTGDKNADDHIHAA